jgi:hypothetical protein
MSCQNSSAANFVSNITGGLSQQVEQAYQNHGAGAWTLPKTQGGGRRRRKLSYGKKGRSNKRKSRLSRRGRKNKTRKVRR